MGDGRSLARLPLFPLVPSPTSSANPIALKDKQVNWLPSGSPQLPALETSGAPGGAWGTGGQPGFKCP